jgi:hypothetical protein
MMSRAGRLIGAAVDSAEISVEALGNAVGISATAINEVRLGEAIMPLSQQLRLARFIIATLPKLRGQAHALEAQATAATGFHAKKVKSHTGPVLNSWAPRKKK